MQNNIMQTGSNWTGKFPRSSREAFGSDYDEPTVSDHITDTIAWIAAIAVLGVFAFFGAAVFGG